MAFGNYLRNAIINWQRGTTFPAAPANLYASLHTADPGATGASELPSSGAYARVTVAAATWSVPTTGDTTNATAAITFPTATADWTAVTHCGLWDQASGGNFIRGGLLTTPPAPHTVRTGATASFAASDFDIQET